MSIILGCDCKCKWTEFGKNIPVKIDTKCFLISKIIGKINYGECRRKDAIKCIDSYLINDYEESHLIFLKIANYLRNYKNENEIDLSNINIIYQYYSV